MCRFVAYLGKPITLDEILYKPTNSLIKQSVCARETSEPLNGDGFGVGWYAHQIDYVPALFTSVLPAWNDRNLQYIAPKIMTSCMLAHVRAASFGGVNMFNTHPFQYDRFLFMHNGDIAGFQTIKRYLRRELCDEIYDWVKGQTDSEHFFALFLNIMKTKNLDYSVSFLADCLREAIQTVTKLQRKFKIKEETTINAVLTDGISMIAVRYCSTCKKDSPTLYYSQGSEYRVLPNGACHMVLNENKDISANLIVSERLTSYKGEWKEIPVNHILQVNPDMTVKLVGI